MRRLGQLLSYTCIMLIILFSNPGASYATDVLVNGEMINFNKERIIDNQLLVPARMLLEKLSAKVSWDGEKQAIYSTLDNDQITYYINNKVALIGDQETGMSAAPLLIDGQAFLPLRSVGQQYHCYVDYDALTNTVNLISNIATIDIGAGVDQSGKIINPKTVFTQDEDVYYVFKPILPIKNVKVRAVWIYEGQNYDPYSEPCLFYSETAEIRDAQTFSFKLPNNFLKVDNSFDRGCGTWHLQLFVFKANYALMTRLFEVVPAQKQSYVRYTGLGPYNGVGAYSEYGNIPDQRYVFPHSLILQKENPAIHFQIYGNAGNDRQVKVINLDTGAQVAHYDNKSIVGQTEPCIPNIELLFPGNYEYAFYINGNYVNSVFLSSQDQ